MRGWKAGVETLRLCECGRVARVIRAEVRSNRQTKPRREEQFDDVRSANRAVVAGPEADVADRRELGRELVRIRGEAVAAVDLVIRVTVAAGDRELLDEGVADDRHLDFGEQLADVERTVVREGRTALAGKVAGLEFDVRVEVQKLLTILGADVDADPAVRPRRLETIFAAFERHVRVGDRLVDVAALEARGLQVVQRRLASRCRS